MNATLFNYKLQFGLISKYLVVSGCCLCYTSLLTGTKSSLPWKQTGLPFKTMWNNEPLISDNLTTLSAMQLLSTLFLADFVMSPTCFKM